MKNQEPLVSVIMACYNHENYVAQAIESVLNQTYDNIELIVADNGSLDGSYEVIKQYKDRITNILHLEKNNPPECSDMLFAAATGDYIAIMTSDDYWEPDKIELQMQAFREHPTVKACATWALVADENLIPLQEQSYKIFFQKNRSRGEWIKTLIFNGNCLAWPSAIMPAEVARKMNRECNRGYRQLGDLCWWLHIILEADIYIIQKPLVKFRVHFTGSNKNESAPTRENFIRLCNEGADITSQVFEKISDELFLEAFRNELVHPDANTPEEILCEKFFVLKSMAENNDYYSSCVYRFFYGNFNKFDENGVNIGLGKALNLNYNYSYIDFSEWSGRMGIAKYGYEMKKVRLDSLSDAKKQMIYACYQLSGRVLSLQEQQDVVGYTAVVDVLNGLVSNLDRILKDMQYLGVQITDEDWTAFKEMIRLGQSMQIDLNGMIFPIVRLIYEGLQVCFL